ncbi:type I-C CRISPR-associated protein Cas8c/Csd1 [Shimazuella kribbensis]|uniref:type I-C CRISPR-associated protein Cas8c/Csd1 n=1 Tax=Shimazuella kribbensis TaxID=139808 RepID=UPI000417E430|nr:type I-C CRISPR-associated protein Cas8c/Csd1 [Shimazuella kribbensis]
MSYLLQLYETYQANLDQVGKFFKKNNDQTYTLLPISHTTQTAHIEVLVSEVGDFLTAKILGKDVTVIPCTEDSASRSGSKIAPYPLHDKLSYVAGDFTHFGGSKGEKPFAHYLEQLKQWATSIHADEKVKSIYQYVRKRTLIADLIKEDILPVGENNKLIEKWDKTRGDKPQIFQTITESIDGAFIRFRVYSSLKKIPKVWEDQKMYTSFIRFYHKQLHGDDYCYVTGKIRASTYRHANKIRHAGDKAKLISSNDNSGFTFRGRFNTADQAANISYDVSQKAHNALKWLIQKQAKIIDNRVFLVWGNHVESVPDPMADTLSALNIGFETELKKQTYTYEHYAKQVANAIDGRKSDLSADPNVNIIVLDSATSGRLAVLYYRQLQSDDYLDQLKSWHTTCVWLHPFQGRYFFGAPSTQNIALAAYGSQVNEKVIKGLMERLLPCIIDGRAIPNDIIRNVFHRASNPVAFKEEGEWEKTLSVACALIHKQQGGVGVELDLTNEDRSYLFGRLLAVADVLERRAMDKMEKRATNAIRYMNAFHRHPERTWGMIQAALQPYQVRLGAGATDLNKLIDQIGAKIKVEDFNNKPLSGKYLHGLYSQRYELYQKKESKKEISNHES